MRLALEVIPNALSTPKRSCRSSRTTSKARDVGICMDVGHAFLMGDLGDAIEACSGHLITTHLHDNDGKTDDHLRARRRRHRLAARR